MHWSELIGGDTIISPSHAWRVKFNNSSVEVKSGIHDPVNPNIVEELSRYFEDFRRAYDEKSVFPAEFDSYPPALRTLRQFIAATNDLCATIRDIMLPDLDDRIGK